MARPAPRPDSPPLLQTDSFGMALYLDAAQPELRTGGAHQAAPAGGGGHLEREGRRGGAARHRHRAQGRDRARHLLSARFEDVPAIVAETVAVMPSSSASACPRYATARPGSRDRVRATTLAYIRIFRVNVGMMRRRWGWAASSALSRALPRPEPGLEPPQTGAGDRRSIVATRRPTRCATAYALGRLLTSSWRSSTCAAIRRWPQWRTMPRRSPTCSAIRGAAAPMVLTTRNAQATATLTILSQRKAEKTLWPKA